MNSMLPITFDRKRNRIRIHKRTLEKLSFPEQVLFLVNPESRMLAILPSAEKRRAYRLHFDPDGSNYEITSTHLVARIYGICRSWQADRSYRVNGWFVEKENAAVFPLDEAAPVHYTEGGQNGNSAGTEGG